ncbi:MAG: oligopeptidase A [Gammaproteobacteria bacterium]|nr:oligopeptidase A [Gammaproteobacteria bacterium]
MNDNPLLDTSGLPHFSTIKAEHVEPAIDLTLAESRQLAEALLSSVTTADWTHLIAPLEAIQVRLSRIWSPVGHLHSVADNEAFRAAYNACLPKLSNYATECGQDKRRYRAYKTVLESSAPGTIEPAQRRILENALRDFRLSGIDLPADKQARFKEVMQALSEHMAKFEQNLLDATQAWHYDTDDVNELRGMPEISLSMAKEAAERAGASGWRLTLDAPSYLAFMTYAEDRALREKVYEAYATRASDQGPNAGKWDNTNEMAEILSLRHEAARLLGYDNYADRALASRMAQSSDQVIAFLSDLAKYTLPVARQEMEELRTYARDTPGLGLDPLQAWDVTFVSERLRRERYSITQEELRPYFPVDTVLNGMFAIVNRLYGIKVTPVTDVETWHPDVRFFDIHGADGELRGRFYLDLYAREHKRGGAWMDECVVRERRDQGVETPVAYLTCNFAPPSGGKPGLLTRDEVTTLFHEFGHGLHHMLTRIDYAGVAGIQGVAWDAVELPSQFMENWCWEAEALPLISGHYETGAPLPAEMLERMLKARDFQAGMKMVRQLEFALFDFRLHRDYDPAKGARQILDLLDAIRKEIAVVIPPSYHRFAHSFAHIFSGGYAAGYYSYKWAEVLSCDAYSLFQEQGIFNPATGRRFLENILEKGGSEDPMTLFCNFRGREPQIDALLRQSGIVG